MELNIEQIEAILPHRFPFLLIDRIAECEPGVYAKSRKCVTANEPFFQGHFPDFKVMPGVLLLEAMAQTGAVAVLSAPENKGRLVLFGGIKNARFKRQVRPGDVVEITCRMTKWIGSAGLAEAEARVDGQVAAKAELSFALADRNVSR